MSFAILDLITGAVAVVLGILVLARPIGAGVAFNRLLGLVNLAPPTRSGVRARGILFVIIGLALIAAGIGFI